MNLRANIFSLSLLCLGLATALSQGATPVIDLDSVIDWDSSNPVVASRLEEVMLPVSKYRRESVFDDDIPQLLYTWGSLPPRDFQWQLFGEEAEIRTVAVSYRESEFLYFSITFTPKRNPASLEAALQTGVEQKMQRKGYKRAVPSEDGTEITWPERNALMVSIETEPAFGQDGKEIRLRIQKRISVPTPDVPVAAPLPPENLEVTVDLDYLLNLSALWNCTPDAFEKIYRVKKELVAAEPPQFEWLTSDRSRARFSKKLFSNLEAKMTIFAKSIKVDEAIVEFVDGRAARVTMSLYNRGDSGDISPEQFDLIYKTTGTNLSQILKVVPLNISNTVTSAVKTVSWQWRSSAGIALLEHNDYKAVRTEGRPEFLRVKLANPQQADWSIGKLSVGVQRMALMKNITKMDNGDVYIAGVPMVDQGDKGYCVAASCQRLFEYMQIPCDQHEIAQLAGVDAHTGADIFDMQKSLARIDGHYKVSFKPHINPELYYGANRKRRISERQFAVIIKEHVDKAVPLLWALQLGRFPEDPPLPNGGQVSGGHMRMIIGYNTAKKQVIFTDSWGAGHEIKRMSEAGAYEATVGLYTMSPRGL